MEILRYRKELSSKIAYKNADKTNHDYVQIGTVIGSRLEGNQGLLKRKEKGERIID